MKPIQQLFAERKPRCVLALPHGLILVGRGLAAGLFHPLRPEPRLQALRGRRGLAGIKRS